MESLPPPNSGQRVKRSLALLAGLLLVGVCAGAWLWLKPEPHSPLYKLIPLGGAVGLSWSLLAAVVPQGRFLQMMNWLSGNALVFALMLGVAEGGFRMAGINFNNLTGQPNDPRAAYPLCFQMGDQPLGDVYFHRKGPVSWTGRPLAQFLEARGGLYEAYQDEQEFTTFYDEDGFRNPADLKDWDVVVVGDSFTESGMLPFEQIFTTQAAKKSGLNVRNLGLCNTGTLSHVEFLKQFGKAPSTRVAVLAFYDGNDILDTELEAADLAKHRATGWRPERVIKPQTSLIKAGYEVVRGVIAGRVIKKFQDAWLTVAGKEIPITIRPAPMPLDPETMTEKQRVMLEGNVKTWAEESRSLGLEPWLLYVPANNRTYHGLLRFTPQAGDSASNWTPGTLPRHMSKLCEALGIHFVDACGVMRAAAEMGVLVYNPILDTHLNVEGSRLIGELLGEELAKDSAAKAL